MNNELRVQVLEAQGWRFEISFIGQVLVCDSFDPNGEAMDSYGSSDICAEEKIISALLERPYCSIPDPTANKAEALELLESTGLDWRIELYNSGTYRILNFNDEDELFPGWRALGSYIKETGSFCEAACRAYLRWKEITSGES